jgi:hypothetical protein
LRRLREDSMTLKQIIEELNLKLLTAARDFSRTTPTAGYASDMLSRVMACAPRDGALWVTLQSHANIVAVGAVLGLSAISITLLATDRPTFYVVGNLWHLGLRDDQ